MSTVQIVDQIEQISNIEWNRLVGLEFPFMQHAFLAALEASQSVGSGTGWIPRHLALYNGTGDLLAAVPNYEKRHSFGEYVFDWSWADAYHRHGLDYYPKLLTAIPFTPAVGPRLCIADGQQNQSYLETCIGALINYCGQSGASSWHLLFPDEALRESLNRFVAEGLLMQRIGVQYHWTNPGYDSFDDFLQTMTSRKRKSIRRERTQVVEQGITFRHVNAGEITSAELEDFYLFYHATYMKRGQQGYLNLPFFQQLVATMPDQVHFVFAELDGTRVAGALFLEGDDTLYGRYWGCLEYYHQLHFETCYYQGIAHCIARGLKRFDAGAQGEHKIQRGFQPIETYSYHWIAHSGFRAAIGEFLQAEETEMRAYIAHARTFLPFKQADSTSA